MNKQAQAENTSQVKRYAIDEIMADFAIYHDPRFLKEPYPQLIILNSTKLNRNSLEKYMELFSNLRYAWQKTLKYKQYFEDFYPPEGKIGKIEALNHHIHAYLEDMTTLKNKIEVLLGEMKNDIKKIASNKSDIDDFFGAGVEKTKKVFAKVSKHRDEHRHRGMRFFDNDLLKAENAHGFLEIISNPMFDATLNQEYKPVIVTKLTKEKEESFEVAKKRWIEMARKNDEQTTGYLDELMKGVRPILYKFLGIRPIQDVIVAAKKNNVNAS